MTSRSPRSGSDAAPVGRTGEGERRAQRCSSSRTAVLATPRPVAGGVRESLPRSSGRFPAEAPLPWKQYQPAPSAPLATHEVTSRNKHLRGKERIKTLWKTKLCGLQKWEMQPSETVMNPKQVFLSVLIFGVAGLHLFIYLQAWIKEQHTAVWMTGSRCSRQASGLFLWGGRVSSGHWSTRDLQAPCNIKRRKSPRDLQLNVKTQLQSMTSKLQCWTPYDKQLARQEHNPTHEQRGCLKS